jgi:hypothetical protein
MARASGLMLVMLRGKKNQHSGARIKRTGTVRVVAFLCGGALERAKSGHRAGAKFQAGRIALARKDRAI